jgi:hypothetical protein
MSRDRRRLAPWPPISRRPPATSAGSIGPAVRLVRQVPAPRRAPGAEEDRAGVDGAGKAGERLPDETSRRGLAARDARPAATSASAPRSRPTRSSAAGHDRADHPARQRRRPVHDPPRDGILDRPSGRVPSAIIGRRTHEQLDTLLASVEVTLSDDILDRIDAIVAPGTDVGAPDPSASQPPALTQTARLTSRRGALRRLTPRDDSWRLGCRVVFVTRPRSSEQIVPR